MRITNYFLYNKNNHNKNLKNNIYHVFLIIKTKLSTNLYNMMDNNKKNDILLIKNKNSELIFILFG